ncbi:hypothetical protein P775_23245 [Puniceibacterium antarcticum]|uniref:GntR C-terminal domain-containing protein n=1 Tax=Puniceibacterium antarcticum TaxID=1206336 RepID=A0A2G8R8D7_9RHOB|nr:GntR family transcriptional regulator [Puniceibacterium antarcticum]PIL17763.1 hypothetical protein P775_23245 [Puniceibacterium antarcticum]
MSRGQQKFKLAVNNALTHLGTLQPGDRLGSEAGLALLLQASRTTVRNLLKHLVENGVVDWNGRDKFLLRLPEPQDYFPETDAVPPADLAEERFLEWVMRSDLPSGAVLREAEIARQIEVAVPQVHDLLIRFEPNGLIGKNTNKNWVLNGFTSAFATELADMRTLIEGEAFARLLAERDSGMVRRMTEMERLHIALLARDDAAMSEFPALDAAFHRLIFAAGKNRFFNVFAGRISLIVHYHYQWNKRDEQARNRVALHEHLKIIRAYLVGDKALARQAFDEHLATARRTLLASIASV